MYRHLHTTLIAGLVAGAVVLSALPAHARKRARPARAETSKAAKSTRKAAETSTDKTTLPEASETAARQPDSAAESAPRTPGPPTSSAAPAKARVYTFSGLDVNGNLKAPQLLFFRGRVKQELDTSNPEKRSFLKELERTADAKGL